MNPYSVLLTILVVLLSHSACPGICDCVENVIHGTISKCSDIFPDVSSFSSVVDHLEINDAQHPALINLTANHFSDNTGLRNLESIRIHNTSLFGVTDNAFGGLNYLYDITITDNSHLTVFHSNSVIKSINLNTLQLSGNENLFTEITGPILVSDSLTELDVSRCGITTVREDTFAKLPKLSYLNLANNNITFIASSAFRNLYNLGNLDLSANFLKNLPWYMLVNSSSLETLNLGGNPISSVPKDIFADSGEGVIALDLSKTKFTSLSLTPLSSLSKLWLQGSQLASLEGLSSFPQLRHLQLSNTKLSSLPPDAFEGNKLLETLKLSGNPRISLPDEIRGTYAFLNYLDMSYCDLDSLKPMVFSKMTEIATLNLSGNALVDSETLGKALYHLKKLRVLDLSNNRLFSIGEDDLSGNGRLATLVLSGNPLTSPPSLKNTPSIIRLDLSNCTLSRLHLPAIFRQAPKLHLLSLAHNGLFSLYDQAYLDPEEDESPWDLPSKLTVVNLRDNPWTCDPSFTSLLYELTRKGVAPTNDPPQRRKRSKFFRNVDREWRQLEIEVCETSKKPVGIILKPMKLPPTLQEATMPKYVIWMFPGIFFGILLAMTPLMYKVFQRKVGKLKKREDLSSVQNDENGNIDGENDGVQDTAIRWKNDYQRLQEDRSPSSPETPRIYRPPNGARFIYPDGKDEESAKYDNSLDSAY